MAVIVSPRSLLRISFFKRKENVRKYFTHFCLSLSQSQHHNNCFMCFRARYNRPNDIRRIIEELKDEEGDGIFDFMDDDVDDPVDIDFEPEQIEPDNQDSVSEVEM